MFLKNYWFALVWLFISMPDSRASPVDRNTLQKVLETQDKVCSMKYAENEGSYKKVFETLSGLNIPSYMKEYDKKPFTGFKLLRTYNVKFFNLALTSSIDFIFCREGKIQWKVKQPLQDDIDWSSPICVHASDVVAKFQVPEEDGGKNISGVKAKTSSRERARQDLSNLHCFKLARRKKYTSRKVSLFFPETWIGGMFYCDLTDDIKRAALDDMYGNLAFKKGKGQNICTQKNSIPLVPVQSDDYSKNWLEFAVLKQSKLPIKTFSPQVTKFVPYIHTPNDAFSRLNFENGTVSITSATSINWRKPFREQALSVFQRNRAYSYGREPWYAEIEVDEKYKITPEDLSLWGNLVDRTVAKLNSVSGKQNRSFFSSSPVDHEDTSTLKRLLRKLLKKAENKVWNGLQLNDKIISIVSEDSKSFETLETQWKNLQMNRENFDYFV